MIGSADKGDPSNPGQRSTLHRPLNSAVLEELLAAGCISIEVHDALHRSLRDPRDWWRWTNRFLLSLGMALVLAGIVLFVAFNWADMRPFLKFTVLEVLLVAFLIGGWFVGLDRLSGKLLLLGASLLVGVVLAVYGQIYQTGADAYELFLGWSLLILGWVVISRFAPLWLLWLILLHLTLVFFWFQVAVPNSMAEESSLFLPLALIDAAALAVREILAGRWNWIAFLWLRWVLLAATLTFLTIPVVLLIVEEYHGTPTVWVSAAVFGSALAGSFWYYRHRSPDLLALTMSALSFSILVLTGIGKVLFEISDDAGMFLFFGLIVVGVISALALWLHHVGRAMRRVNSG